MLRKVLCLDRTVVEGVRIEGDSIVVSARPRKAAPRCPVCGARCEGYDRRPARRWRAPDLGASRCYAEYAPRRVRCPELGVSNARVEAVNNKIKVAIRQGYGFRNIDNLIALVMPRRSDLKPRLPGRAGA